MSPILISSTPRPTPTIVPIFSLVCAASGIIISVFLKNRVSIGLMNYHISLTSKLSYLIKTDIIAINLLDQKILLATGKMKKINAERELSINKVKRVGI